MSWGKVCAITSVDLAHDANCYCCGYSPGHIVCARCTLGLFMAEVELMTFVGCHLSCACALALAISFYV